MMLNGLSFIAIRRRRKLLEEAWNASRKSLVIDFPNEEKPSPYDDYTDGCNSGIEACKIELEDKGFKVKRK